MRDHATIAQLLVLANIEGMNAEFIHMDVQQSERLKRLNQIAIRQMQVLATSSASSKGFTGTALGKRHRSARYSKASIS